MELTHSLEIPDIIITFNEHLLPHLPYCFSAVLSNAFPPQFRIGYLIISFLIYIYALGAHQHMHNSDVSRGIY